MSSLSRPSGLNRLGTAKDRPFASATGAFVAVNTSCNGVIVLASVFDLTDLPLPRAWCERFF